MNNVIPNISINTYPNGIRNIQLRDRNINVFHLPTRDNVKDLSSIEEDTERYGVYFLFGSERVLINETWLESKRVYIGESVKGESRLKNHSSKSFWNEAFLFTSKENFLTESHFKWLESKLIKEIRDAGRFIVENDNQPSQPSLSKMELQSVYEFYHYIVLILKTFRLGEMLETSISASKKNDLIAVDKPAFRILETEDIKSVIKRSNDGLFLFSRGKIIDARGRYLPGGGFEVYKDSIAKSEKTICSMSDGNAQKRQDLINTGKLLIIGDKIKFVDNVIFTSSSQAASIISGGSESGPRAWVEYDLSR